MEDLEARHAAGRAQPEEVVAHDEVGVAVGRGYGAPRRGRPHQQRDAEAKLPPGGLAGRPDDRHLPALALQRFADEAAEALYAAGVAAGDWRHQDRVGHLIPPGWRAA